MKLNIKSLLVIALNIVFIILFILAILKVNFSIVFSNLKKISWFWAFVILVLFLLSYIFKALRFKMLISNLSFKQVLIATIYQNFFIFLLPFRAGELSYIKKLKEYNISWKKSSKDLIFTRLNDFLFLGLIAAVILWFAGNNLSNYSVFIFFLIPLLILGLIFFEKLFRLEKIKITKKLKFFIFSGIVWFFTFLPWILVLTILTKLNITQMLFIIGIVLISTFIPINPPAGIGLINSAWSFGLILVGFDFDSAIGFGVFAYGLYVMQITIIFLLTKTFEKSFCCNNKL